MKIIILGLGNFGAPLATKLTERGHEVIGVDKTMARVEMLKDKITHTICMDSTDLPAVKALPIADADVVVIALGEDAGANIMSTALMKQLNAKRVVCRAISPLQQTILEAMQMQEIVHPEEEAAERLAIKLNMQGVLNSYALSEEYNIVEAQVPGRYAGKTIEEIGFRRNYNLVVLASLKKREEKNLLGMKRLVTDVQEVPSASTMLAEGDVLVLYGNIKDLRRFMKE